MVRTGGSKSSSAWRSWRPVIGKDDGARTGSRFGGTPWLAFEERWPACGHCHAPMQLFVQLEQRTLPREVRDEVGEGLIQLFYCTSKTPHCEVECQAWRPYSSSVLARLVSPVGPPNVRVRPPRDAFPPARIVSWRRQADSKQTPKQNDKLFGFPFWVQGEDYPRCPDCHAKMRLVLQIDSNDHLPHTFGDVGCGHLTQCAKHRHRLAFCWACA